MREKIRYARKLEILCLSWQWMKVEVYKRSELTKDPGETELARFAGA